MKFTQIPLYVGATASITISLLAYGQTQSDQTSYRIGHGLYHKRVSPDAFIVLDYSSGAWQLKEILDSPPAEIYGPGTTNLEVLAVSQNTKIIEPYYVPYWEWKYKKAKREEKKILNENINEAPTNYIVHICDNSAESKSRPAYSPCTSKFTDSSPGFALFSAVFSFGTQVATMPAVVPEKVRAAINESNAIAALNQWMPLKVYRDDFVRATTSSKISKFIDQYSNNDPDSLVPQAKAKLQDILMKEETSYRKSFDESTTIIQLERFINRYSQNDPAGFVPKARDRIRQLQKEEDQKSASRQQIQRETIARETSAVKSAGIGAPICHTFNGTRVESTGYLVLGKPTFNEVPGVTMIKGFVEDFRSDRIKISVSGMRHRTIDGDWVTLDSASYIDSDLKPGSVIWDRIERWKLCGT